MVSSIFCELQTGVLRKTYRELKLIEIIAISVVSIILGGVLLFSASRLGLKYMEHQSVLVVGIDIAGMFISYVLSISCLVDYQKPDSEIKYFILMIVVAYIALFADAMGCLMNGLPGLRAGNFAFNMVS